MRRRFIFDPDLDAVIEITHGSNAYAEPPPASGVQIIRDIEPYRPVAADTDGKRHVIGGRRQHREFLARNGYVEVGNERPIVPGAEPDRSRADRITDIRRAMGDFGSRVRD